MNLPLLDQQREFAIVGLPATGLATSLEQRRLRIYLGQMIADIAALFIANLVADCLYLGVHWATHNAFWLVTFAAQMVLPFYLTIALYNGTYSLDSLRAWRLGAMRALAALAISPALFNFVVFFARLDAQYSRNTFLICFAVTSVLFVGARWVGAEIVSRWLGPSPVNVLVIDDGGPAISLPHSYRVDAAAQGLRPTFDNPHALDLLGRCVRNMDQVIVTCDPAHRARWASSASTTS